MFTSLALASAVRADVLVGGISGSDSSVAHPVVRYTDYANGHAPPLSSLSTDNPGERLQTPFAIAYEPIENVIYVSDFYGQAVRVYPVNASGNVAATRILTSPLLGQPRRVAISTLHDEMFTTLSGCCVAAFVRTASGNMTPRLRSLQWGGLGGSVTRLNSPNDLAYRESSDEIIVAESSSGAGVLLFFDRLADGNTAPLRTIEGAQTSLGLGVLSVFYDSAHDEFIALVQVDGNGNSRIATFAGTASGNALPLRVIEGASTALLAASSVTYDAAHSMIYVTAGGYNAYPNVLLGFPRSANGNLAPAKKICGSTLPTEPIGVAVVPSVDALFGSGFDLSDC